MAKRLLLDVNVWIALFDEAHSHHALAEQLFNRPKLKIATCPIIENGVIRVLNLPAYTKFGPIGFDTVAKQLARVCASVDHEFWPDDTSLRHAPINWSRVLGHWQITDVYLLALAVSHGGCFSSFDQRIALSAVKGAEAGHLLLL
ncbi:MAG: hypothetical protein RLZZ502_608 [Pseudomonadota bacterium]